MADYNHVIDVDQWTPDATYDGVYPKGAREKDVLFAPKEPLQPCILPEHRYLLKKSFARYPWQYWMEVIAYRVGQVLGVPVPPAFVGSRHRPDDGPLEYGALIEWFYDPEHEGYTDGGRYMACAIKDFDVKRGTQHNFKTIIAFLLFPEKLEKLIESWTDILTFDTIIGNTDRHQDNWGVISNVVFKTIEKSNVDEKYMLALSPAFDNGTALGHEILEQNFAKFEDDKVLFRYLTNPAKARHHMRWSLEDATPLNFFGFIKRLVEAYPFVKDRVLRMIDFTQSTLEERLSALPMIQVDPESQLTEARLAFTIRLIMKRRELLLKELTA